MSDIVERLIHAWPGNQTKLHCEAAVEIKSLRQRVKELEVVIKDFAEIERGMEEELAELKAEMKQDAEGPDWIQRAMQAEAELEILKQSQGEPVAYLHKWKPHANTIGRTLHFVRVSPHGDDVEITPLCLCTASTIPEGLRLVPIEPTEEMLLAADGMNFDLHGVWHTMLAAAPKPKDVK